MDNQKRIILGIDPGSRCTGYGVIWAKGSQQGYIAHGHIKTTNKALNFRLYEIQQALLQVIEKYHPDEAAIEQVFTLHNHQSALKLGQARGAALATTAAYHLCVAEYSARSVKQAIVGYGAATKAQVQHMVTLLLKLTESPQEDSADALAIALCHATTARIQQKIKQATEQEPS